MRRVFGVGMLLASLLVGCGGDSASSPSGRSAANPQDLASFRVLLDYDADGGGEQAQHYRLQVLDGETVVLSQEVDRPGAAPLAVFLREVPPGTYRLRAIGFSAQGEQFGHFEQEVEVVAGRATPVTVSSIWNPGKTCEIGLVSVNSAGDPNHGDCHECVCNASGRFVLFQCDDLDGSGQGLFLRDRLVQTTTRLPAPNLSSGFSTPLDRRFHNISISGDGRFIAYEFDSRHFLQDRFARDFQQVNTLGLSTLSPDGNFFVLNRGAVDLQDRAGDSRQQIFPQGRNGRVSADSDTVACAVGTSQREDIAVKVRSTGTSRLFPVGKPIPDLQLSGDGNWVAFVEAGPSQGADGPLRLLDVRSGRITTITDEAQPGLSISQDGQIVAFRSSDANLVFNDANGEQDLFTWNRRNRLFTRVNIAADGGALRGGVSDACPPMLSSDGRRVVFLSAQLGLVPGPDPGGGAVFSSQVPGSGIAYLASGNRILRLPGAERLSGSASNIPPSAVLFEASPGISIGELYLDVAKDRLFAVVNTLPRGEVRVLNNASSRLAGDPTIVLNIPANGIAGDSTRGLVYVSLPAPGKISVQAVRSESNVSLPLGNRWEQSNFGSGKVVSVDTSDDEIYLGFQGLMVSRNGASTFNGVNPPSVGGFGSALFRPEAALQKVVSALAIPDPVFGQRVVVMSVSGAVGRLGLYPNGLGGGTNFDVDQTPQKVQLLPVEDSTTPNDQLEFDRFSGMLYVATFKGLLVFNRFIGTPVQSPDRIFGLPCQGVVVDRTRVF